MATKKLSVKDALHKPMHRSFAIDKIETRADGEDTVFDLSVSSDAPYRRDFGYEILSHAPDAVDFSRVNSGMQVLYNHDANQYVGVVEKMYLAGNKARAVVRFSKNSALAQQIKRDVQDGILRSVSIGYNVEKWDAPRERKTVDGVPMLTALRWGLYEVSIVTIPADNSVGFGRSAKTQDDGMGDATDSIAQGLEELDNEDDAEEKAATEDTAWSKPSLADFTDKQWGDLSPAEKAHIGSHFMWAPKTAKTFGDLKLPYKNPKTGAVNKAALGNILARLNQTQGIPAAAKAKIKAQCEKLLGEKPKEKSLKQDGAEGQMLCPRCMKAMVQVTDDEEEAEAEEEDDEMKQYTCPNCGATISLPDEEEGEPPEVEALEKLGEALEDAAEAVEELAEAEAAEEAEEEGEEEEEEAEEGDTGKDGEGQPSEVAPPVVASLNSTPAVERPYKSLGTHNAAHKAATPTHIGVSHMKDTLDTLSSVGAVNLTEKEQKTYSLSRAILNQIEGKRGFEHEVSDTVAKLMGKDTTGFYMPTSLDTLKRDFAFGDASTGGAISQLTVAGTLIDFLRNVPVVARMGATVMALPTKLAIPRLDADLSANWIAEDGAGSSIGSASLDQVILSPKKLNFYTGYTLELLRIANLSIETLIRDNIYRAAATAYDKAVFQTPANGPTGLDQLTGVVSGSFTSGSAISYTSVASTWASVAKQNVLQVAGAKPAWVMTPQVLASARTTPMFTGSAFYPIVRDNDEMFGEPVFYSNNLPVDTLYFGAWDNVILASFGAGIEIVTDIYTQKHRGIVEIGANMLADINFRHPVAFALYNGIKTS